MTKLKKIEREFNLSELIEFIEEFGIVDGFFESDDVDSYVEVKNGEYRIGYQVTSQTRFKFKYYEQEEDSTLDNLEDLISIWAVDRNLHTADSSKQAVKLGEEYGELCEGLSKGKPELIKDALGDMFVVMVILAMQEDLDFTECVEMAYNEIKDRKGELKNGIYVKESDLT